MTALNHVEEALKIANDKIAQNTRLQALYTESASKARTPAERTASEIMSIQTSATLQVLFEMKVHLTTAKALLS
jgi:hypothetical protein